MDYYDILGIRPSASATEIELAYKGRRSQYHPDRYAASDADTISWATSKIKEVNEAYNVLIDPASRANFDRRTARQADPSTQAQTGSTNGGQGPANPERQATKDAASILLRPDWDWQLYDKIHARPNIPQKKLAGAISSYAFGVSPLDAIVLLDDTVFGGAKEGLLVTSDAIYCKQKFEDPIRMAFSEIKRVGVGTESNLIINGQEFFKAIVIDQVGMANFSSRLSKVFEQPATHANGAERRNHEPSTDSSGADLLWRVHCGAMTVLKSELNEEGFLLDELIDCQMKIIADEFRSVRAAMDKMPSPPRTSVMMDADTSEFALMLFSMLHYHSFTKLPYEFHDSIRNSVKYILGVSELYKSAFREEFTLVFGRALKADDDLTATILQMFLLQDGNGNFKFKMPRESDLVTFLGQLHISENMAHGLLRSFEGQAESWYNAIASQIDEEDD